MQVSRKVARKSIDFGVGEGHAHVDIGRLVCKSRDALVEHVDDGAN